jgi:hypothetical protein
VRVVEIPRGTEVEVALIDVGATLKVLMLMVSVAVVAH